MKVTERKIKRIDKIPVTEDVGTYDNIDIKKFVDYIKLLCVPVIRRNSDDKIYAIEIHNHDGTLKSGYLIDEITEKEEEMLEELLK